MIVKRFKARNANRYYFKLTVRKHREMREGNPVGTIQIYHIAIVFRGAIKAN